MQIGALFFLMRSFSATLLFFLTGQGSHGPLPLCLPACLLPHLCALCASWLFYKKKSLIADILTNHHYHWQLISAYHFGRLLVEGRPISCTMLFSILFNFGSTGWPGRPLRAQATGCCPTPPVGQSGPAVVTILYRTNIFFFCLTAFL